jgi:hypothetical protein
MFKILLSFQHSVKVVTQNLRPVKNFGINSYTLTIIGEEIFCQADN